MPTTIEEKSERSSKLPAASPIRAEVNSPRMEEVERKLVGVRQYTPNTELSTPRWNPDISIYCHTCQELVPIKEIVQHKRYHKELKRFGLAAGVGALTPNHLNAARKRKVKQLGERLGGDRVSSTDVERVNERYAFLKAYLFEENRGRMVLASRPVEQIPAYDVESRGLRCSVPFVLGAGTSRYHNPKFGRRPVAFAAYQDWLGGDPGKCYAGLFCGRYGDTAAQLASEELHHFLLCELARFDPGTRCTCAFNMADLQDGPGRPPAGRHHSEIHRPATSAGERERLHWASANLVQRVLRTCAERLDATAVAYARSRTPDLRWYDEGEGGNPDDANADGWADKVSAAFAKALEYTDGLLKRGQANYSAVRWSGASIGAVLIRSAAAGGVADVAGDAGVAVGSRRRLGWVHAAACGDVRLMLVRNNRPHGLASSSPARGIGYHGDPELKRRISCRPDCRCVAIDTECQAVVMVTPGVTSVLGPAEICQLVATHLPVNRVRVDSCLEDSDRLRLAGPDTRVASETSSRASTPSSSEEIAASASASSLGDCFGESDGDYFDGADGASQGPLTESRSATAASAGGRDDGPDAWVAEAESAAATADATADWATALAEEVAQRLTQAALLAGSHEDLAATVLLLPAAFQLD